MKKYIIAGISAILVSLSVVPAQAEEQKSIAIIDMQFNSSLVGGNILDVCVSACNTNLVPKSYQLSDYNHGTQMAQIVRKNNPDVRLILIRAGATNVSPVTSLGLRDALSWIIANKVENNIIAVSASINAGNPATCTPVGGVQKNDIISRIDAMQSIGVPLIASAGNAVRNASLNYPACLPNVIAVTSPNRQGIGNGNLDYLVRTDKTNFTTSYGPVSFLTTSATAALVAANWEKLSKNQVNAGLQITLNVLQ